MRWKHVVGFLALGGALLAGGPVAAQAGGTITGRVTAAGTGEPVAGAAVRVADTQLGALTGADGRYTITSVPAGSRRVTATRVGYAAGTQTVTVAAGQTVTADLTVEVQAVQLEGIVAIGYGTQERRNVTASIASVSAEELQVAPVTTVEQGLLGRAAGVQVVTSSGAPGAGAAVRIRGGNSIGASNEPLYVVDGVPMTTNTGDTNAGSLIGGTQTVGNPLASLSPHDIESIEVLKDASGTAIYGARAANGVVLITTKRGRAGQSAVNFGSYYGVQQVRKKLDLLNAGEYARLVNEVYANAGRGALFSESEIAGFGAGTDWQDQVFRDAPVQNYDLSVSGGSDRTRYFVSGSLLRNEGTVIGSSFDRGAFRLNLDQDVSERFRLGNRLTFSRSTSEIIANSGSGGDAASVVIAALRAAPILSPRDSAGGFFRGNDPVTGRPFANPVAQAELITNREMQNRVLGNLFGEYDVLEGLKARVSLGMDYVQSQQKYFSPRTVLPGSRVGGEARRGDAQTTTWLNENTLTYSRDLLGDSEMELLGGVTFQRATTDITGATAQDFLTDKLGADALGTGALRQNMYSDAREWTLASYLSRAHFTFADKYLLTLTGRIDGSSRFGEGNKYGFFPSIALGWRLGDEPFIADLGLFSDLKLRASYGRTGNQEIGLYQSLSRLQSVGYVLGGQRLVGFVPSTPANRELKWETTDQLDAGLDAGFFDGRLTLTADYYQKKTNDLLLQVGIPMTSGASSMLRNVGSVKNHGAELGVSTVNVEGERFRWESDLNLSFNRNEVVDLGDKDEIINPTGVGAGAVQNPTILRKGEPINSFYGYRFTGLDAQGRATYQDTNADGKVTSDDKVILGSAEPTFIGGLTNRLSYGPFDLSVFVQWSVGNEVYNLTRALLTNARGDANQLKDVLEGGSANALTPRADNTFDNWESDLFVEDGSFLRGKNIRLGYTVPVERLGLRGFKSLGVYVSAQNFFTLTDYRGFDPEISEYAGSNLAQGIDFGTYPQTRQITFGINAGF